MTSPTDQALVDILLIEGRTDQDEMLLRLRTLALACASLREVVDGRNVSTDEQFDVGAHVRLEAIAQPRSVREVKLLASRLLIEPFPSGRPEWSLHYVEKVTGNRSALVIRRSARYDERLLHALRGTPLESSVDQTNQRFDVSRILGFAQQMLVQPDPLNALVDRAATIAARVMEDIERPSSVRSTLWVHRSHGHEHQDLRIDRDHVSREAERFGVDERSLLLACLAETVSRMHEHAPLESVLAGIAIRRSDVDPRLRTNVSLPTSAMPFVERVQAIDELLLHLPQPRPSLGIEVDEWMPPAIVRMVGSRLAHSIDIGCVFAEPIGTLTAIGIEHFSVVPIVATLGAATTMIATVDGNDLRLGFAVDPASGTTAEAIREAFETTLLTQCGWSEPSRGFSRWWASLRKQSARA